MKKLTVLFRCLVFGTTLLAEDSPKAAPGEKGTMLPYGFEKVKAAIDRLSSDRRLDKDGSGHETAPGRVYERRLEGESFYKKGADTLVCATRIDDQRTRVVIETSVHYTPAQGRESLRAEIEKHRWKELRTIMEGRPREFVICAVVVRIPAEAEVDIRQYEPYFVWPAYTQLTISVGKKKIAITDKWAGKHDIVVNGKGLLVPEHILVIDADGTVHAEPIPKEALKDVRENRDIVPLLETESKK